MSQFTPGPWRCDPDLPDFTIRTADETLTIANVRWTGNTPATEANAHLIAAAPEMYEALKYWLECKDLSGLDIAIAKGRSALAKAEGRS